MCLHTVSILKSIIRSDEKLERSVRVQRPLGAGHKNVVCYLVRERRSDLPAGLEAQNGKQIKKKEGAGQD